MEKETKSGIRTDWTSLTENQIKKGDKAFGLLTGEKSKVLVLDFDDKDLYNEYCMKYPIIVMPKSSTQRISLLF